MRVTPASLRTGDGRMFQVEVELPTGRGARRSRRVLQVAYDQLSLTLRRLGQSGARVLSITSAAEAGASGSDSAPSAPATTDAMTEPAAPRAMRPYP